MAKNTFPIQASGFMGAAEHAATFVGQRRADGERTALQILADEARLRNRRHLWACYRELDGLLEDESMLEDLSLVYLYSHLSTLVHILGVKDDGSF